MKEVKHTELFYVNSKGNRVDLGITNHALERFEERWALLNPGVKIGNVEKRFRDSFMSSERVTQYTKKDKDRMKRYKGGTLYFKNNSLIFVVQDCKIITVEIGGKKRRLNKGEEYEE
jgi:hypothetical protein